MNMEFNIYVSYFLGGFGFGLGLGQLIQRFIMQKEIDRMQESITKLADMLGKICE